MDLSRISEDSCSTSSISGYKQSRPMSMCHSWKLGPAIGEASEARHAGKRRRRSTRVRTLSREQKDEITGFDPRN